MSTTTTPPQPSPYTTPPPPLTTALLTFPTPTILLLTLNRPHALNALTTADNHELAALFTWYDAEPRLRCAIITGAGRAFCSGADLVEWHARNEARTHGSPHIDSAVPMFPAAGFAALSRRHGKKPVVGAVNGLAVGGGMEVVASLDIVVAARSAVFALPEAERGVVAMEGSLPRLVRTVGRQRAMEMALTARRVGAEEARDWGFVNEVTEDAGPEAEVMERPVVRRALEFALAIAAKSPDSVIVSRAGVVSGWEEGSAENATRIVKEIWEPRLNSGENLREGIRAFAEKRQPRWLDSRL
ncbi:Enoyl-hydratase [Neofusicoccum parvum]|uniref:Enoyl-hydratase n=1 Tax=Neofusicoccum parvum TaxID=310453 RepID=A0ACB5SLZ0_9PEZI|nr:Enoyl-hydratase [Neofusicoccum parvum]